MNRIKQLRKEIGKTQLEMADYFHVTPQTFGYWETDKHQIALDDFHTLAQIFKVSMEYLGGYSNERNR